MSTPNMKVKIAGLELSNPVMNASGTVDALSPQNQVPIKQLGAYVTKTVTLNARYGNKPPRIWEISHRNIGIGMLNSIGLQGEGLKDFSENKLPQLKAMGVPLIVSIGGHSHDVFNEELVPIIDALADINDIAVEVNLSCPNIPGGIAIGKSFALTYNVMTLLTTTAPQIPLIVKLTPMADDIALVAQMAQDAGAVAISACNSFEAMDVDIETKRPRLGNIYGGYSGPAILPQALYNVWQIAQAVDIPVIGIGGIISAEDAIKFFLVGATAVAVGTANFANPKVIPEIVEGIEQYLISHNIADIHDIIGKMKKDDIGEVWLATE